jgi:hypothetical protein
MGRFVELVGNGSNNHRRSVRLSIAESLYEFEHKINPLHVYCRLVDHHIGRRTSMRLSKCYEICVHPGLVLLISAVIAICRSRRTGQLYR